MPVTTEQARLPWAPLLVLALSGFVMIMTETLPAGLLVQIARGLRVSDTTAGQLVTVYAAGTVLAAVPTITLTRRWRRKPLLLAGIFGFVVVNLATATISELSLTLGLRFLAGCLSGLVWGLIPGYARRIVPPTVAGRGLAIAGIGTPLALALGTPLGTLVGTAVGWRLAFGGLSGVAALLLAWAVIAMPDAKGQLTRTQTPALKVVSIAGIAPILGVVFAWMLAHNILYTYIAPFVAVTDRNAHVDVVLLTFGISSLVGIWLTGILVDRALRRLVLSSLAGFTLAAAGLLLASHAPVVLYAATIVWGVTFGGASTQLNTATGDAAGDDRDVAAAWVSTAWNLAILGGSTLGGVLLIVAGARVLPSAMLPLILVALVLAALARQSSFPSDSRRRSN